MTPPRAFAEALKRFDPLLRCRWGVHRSLWMIEERIEARNPTRLSILKSRPNPWGSSPRSLDRYDGWKDGYLHVLDVPPEDLAWERVVPTLDWASIARKSRREDFQRQLDEADEREEAATERALQNRLEAATSEAYDRLAWLQGHRVGWHEPAETKLTPVIARDGYVVVDRRAVSA